MLIAAKGLCGRIALPVAEAFITREKLLAFVLAAAVLGILGVLCILRAGLVALRILGAVLAIFVGHGFHLLYRW